jgi:hypothetical protein
VPRGVLVGGPGALLLDENHAFYGRFPLLILALARMAELVRAYADLPLGAVDASVIAIAEGLKLTDVATLDRRHFTVRPKHAKALNLLP